MLKKVHPPRPDWYEEFYASVMDKSMKSYEAEVSSHLVSVGMMFVINQFLSFQVYTSLAAIL